MRYFSIFFIFIGFLLLFSPKEINANISCGLYTAVDFSCSIPPADGGCGFGAGEFCSATPGDPSDLRCYVLAGNTLCGSDGNYCSASATCQRFYYGYSCDVPFYGGGCAYGEGLANDDTCTNLCSLGQVCSSGSCVVPTPTPTPACTTPEGLTCPGVCNLAGTCYYKGMACPPAGDPTRCDATEFAGTTCESERYNGCAGLLLPGGLTFCCNDAPAPTPTPTPTPIPPTPCAGCQPTPTPTPPSLTPAPQKF